MKIRILIILFFAFSTGNAQLRVDVKNFRTVSGARVRQSSNTLFVSWPAGTKQQGQLVLNLDQGQALFQQVSLAENGDARIIAKNLDPVFLLTVGKRDLVSQNGWNVFFDKVPLKPFQAYRVMLEKKNASVRSEGSRTVISIGDVTAPGFSGSLEITLYNGSPLFNIAAVLSTAKDSTAIIYDAGLISKKVEWRNVAFSDVSNGIQVHRALMEDTAKNQAVKYRTIIGETSAGSLAIFPAPHQFFYPLDEAFNLKFTWHGSNYRNLIPEYGLGIRQDLYGDKRFVPWFNAPPGTRQRLNFFCLLSRREPIQTLAEVKKFTHGDTYPTLRGYKKMASHFHNEFVMSVVLAGKPVVDTPNFIKVFQQMGLDIVHLGEFHYTAHPKGPDSLRLKELHALFSQCQRLSSDKFLLLPGEEPNEFFGGHWMQVFPKPVYWIMSRRGGLSFESQDPVYGKVYRVSNAGEMLDLLKIEKGLAWTAHPRTKGSTGYPDRHKNEAFFQSDRFLGAAWKPMPADLSEPRLGKRVLDLMDDMNNWGTNKKVLSEADLFTVEPENEMYAHLNVNYLQLDQLPSYNQGWQPVLDVMQKGKFFSTTGEVLIPSFTVNNSGAGDTAIIASSKKATVSFSVEWTFPLQFAEIISGDGTRVYRHKINLESTMAFGKQTFKVQTDLTNKKWVRLEVWDVAVNGAYTQTIWLQNR